MNWLTSRSAPFVALAALALASCDKGTALNVDLPDTAAVNTAYKDIPLDVATVRLAPVQTIKASHFLVGRLADNIAGETTAGAYFNLIDASGINTLLGSGGSFSSDSLPATLTNPRLDSVVLVAGFDQVYGSSTTPAKFDVYKLAAPLDERQVYDSSTPATLDAQLGQNLTTRLDRTQVQVVTAAVPATLTAAAIPAVTAIVSDPTVRLVLQRTAVPATPGRPTIPAVPSQFATDLFGQLSTIGFGQKQLDVALKGLAILPSASHTGSIVSFSKAFKSRIVVYYHAGALRRAYSLYFGPAFSSLGLTSSRDPRYYTTITNTLPPALAALATRAGAVSPAALNGTSYVQEGTGLGTRVVLKNRVTLGMLTQSNDTANVVINRAELLVPIKPFTNSLFTSPNMLYAIEINPGNVVLQRTMNFLETDRVVQADGANPLGSANPAIGLLNNTTAAQSYYSLPVTSYLQAYFNNSLGGYPWGLVLVPNIRTSSGLSLNRAALDAANIRLRVYFSKKR